VFGGSVAVLVTTIVGASGHESGVDRAHVFEK
jgi:hypothetical protein